MTEIDAAVDPPARTGSVRLSVPHLVAALTLFAVEVVIAVAVHDDFVRPYVGDVLVVVLIHCAVRAVVELPVPTTAAGVLGFAYLVELAQLAGVGDLVEGHRILRVVVGSTFQWGDLVAYAAGAALALVADRPGHGRSSLRGMLRT